MRIRHCKQRRLQLHQRPTDRRQEAQIAVLEEGVPFNEVGEKEEGDVGDDGEVGGGFGEGG